MNRLRDLRERDESGFTLIELLVGTVMLAIIIGALVAAVIMTLGTQKTQDRLVSSHDEQLAAAHFAGDIASAASFADRTTPSPCATSGVLLSTSWTDPVAGQIFVDYALNGKELTRSTCLGIGGAKTIAIAHDVATAVVRCANSSGTTVTCPSGTPNSTLTEVDLQITDAGGKNITLTATRRVP